MRVFLASKNPGKAREIAAILGTAGIELAGAPQDWVAPEETGTTYRENALLKARSLLAFTGAAAVADDSGIEVDALDGAPGVRSARFAGEGATDEENLAKLIDVIRATPPDRRGARYRCVAVFVSPDTPEVSTDGVVEGSLIEDRRGSGGFGYDPIFVAIGQTRTMAQMSAAEKDAISHRGKAFRALATALQPQPSASSDPQGR